MTALALPLALVALALAGTQLASLVASPLLSRLPARHVPSALALLVAAGAAVALAAVLPAHASGCHCLADAGTVVHLCAAHPERAWPLLLPATAVIAALLVRPALAVARCVRTARVVRRALGGASPAPETDRLLLTELPLRNAFSVASGGGRILADRAWWEALAGWERRAILAHEAAHLRRRDPLVGTALALGAAFVPARVGAPLLDRWRLRAEQCADAAAARAIGDPVAVADLLVRQHRAVEPRLASLPALANACSLERRVEALLDEGPSIDDPPQGAGLPLIAVGTALLAAWIASPAVHDVTETVIAWMR